MTDLEKLNNLNTQANEASRLLLCSLKNREHALALNYLSDTTKQQETIYNGSLAQWNSTWGSFLARRSNIANVITNAASGLEIQIELKAIKAEQINLFKEYITLLEMKKSLLGEAYKECREQITITEAKREKERKATIKALNAIGISPETEPLARANGVNEHALRAFNIKVDQSEKVRACASLLTNINAQVDHITDLRNGISQDIATLREAIALLIMKMM